MAQIFLRIFHLLLIHTIKSLDLIKTFARYSKLQCQNKEKLLDTYNFIRAKLCSFH